MRFRPCIDLREGRVVQIIGSSLMDKNSEKLKTNFETDRSPGDFAKMYKDDNLPGGHVISLGSGNEDAALSALRAYPGGFHIGGGITPQNAIAYLEAGASHIIVTSYVFSNGRIDMEKLKLLQKTVGKNRLVLDLSCRKKGSDFWIVTDRWQKFTNEIISPEILNQLADHCDEFLVHGVDVEGKMEGIQEELIEILGKNSPIPVTYAGGVKALSDLGLVKEVGSSRVDLTIGSALDIFGGSIPYRSVVEWFQN
ncbi:MAG: phosphoribosylformimino-5-aminoimidazole carboxamide ribotide isomerase [Candidatus Scalindua rubra]|uniref:Imidazole glycerol phosphate synthase subunit HisF n=1 Tax=Candidatus Scalindua brodae TaxID=237368 RepID=A0A0B0EP72_9BACT|nr:MAG: Imidazole glycerol phosphate synthase subunit HisF [Candidatus Scalindua brodae]MBZ0107559.1 phosphoribosylformimino-5-aminoimidazole carboxamide ribotide isomerase [Candidatus Scalindua rubra]TWU34767.1 1-(5-phosphoribosyl)-5-[(5-phosphoribosylamino)methylideneamino] imidazole-4-carboxamide isomerase [Candidatus Brocadiaceae bacterium S225]